PAQWGDALHDGSRAAVCAYRETAADDLPEAGEVGPDAVERLGPAVRDTKARDDLVEDQERAVPVAEFAEPREETGCGRHHAHVARDRLHDDRRHLLAARRHERRYLVQIVEGHSDGQRGQGRGHAQTVGHAEGGPARARLDEETVGVPVIAALELDDGLATREAAGETDGAHGRLG